MSTENGFVDRTAELNFTLTKLDGKVRCQMLDIHDYLYESRSAAIEWFTKKSDEAANCTPEAKQKLQDIYNNMTY